MNVTRILLAAAAAVAAAVLCVVPGLCLSERVLGAGEVSADDFNSVVVLTSAATMLVCALFYAPGLLLLRRRRGCCRPASHFLLASTLALNLPAFTLALVALARRQLSGPSEAAIFVAAFLAAGLAFGLVFVALCREPAARASQRVKADG